MRVDSGQFTSHNNDALNRKILVLTWAFFTTIWSIFTPPDRTYVARVLLLQPLWIYRIWRADTTWAQDLTLFLALHAVFGYFTGLWNLYRIDDFAWLDFNSHELWLYIKVFSLLGACGVLAGGIVHRGGQLETSTQNCHLTKQRIDEQLLPPLLISSRTTHTRLFPQKHAFSYSYLLVGVPIGVHGRVSNALSVDADRRSWFDVRSEDFLARGNATLRLGEKLKRYLHTQGVTDRDYAFAYLVTAPRFMGYNFNPVSFWYLYDSETRFKYMILEVNNTFDERRMYLLQADAKKDDDSTERLFTQAFDKDFHVSPFNSRKGSYSLRAVDPLAAYEDTGHVKIDNNIVLRSSKDSPKIVARVWSEGSPLDATTITKFQLYQFIARWWWVGFLTFPRIVWQAQKLFFQKKLHVWFRPEVAETSIGREYTQDERRLEPYFRAFLEDAVAHTDRPLRVVYEAPHVDGEVAIYTPDYTYEEDSKRSLTIRVITPAFYSRFVHYAPASEAFDREGLATDEKDRTVVIDPPSLLPDLLDGMKRSKQGGVQRSSLLDIIRWPLLRKLRCPPLAASYPEHTVSDIRAFGEAEIDIYVRKNSKKPAGYTRTVIKLFFAVRYAFGLPPLVTAIDWASRAALLLAAMEFCRKTVPIDVLRPRPLTLDDIASGILAIALANSIHFWALVKGHN